VTARVAICDYGVGNVRSVERALLAAGAQPVVTTAPEVIDHCDGAVLPGVGAFAAALQHLHDAGLAAAVRRVAGSGRPLLGVCLGHQLLFEHSDEGEGGDGLGLIPGHVSRLRPAVGKVPHLGWNRLRILRDAPLLDGIGDHTYMYFVHAYAGHPRDRADVVATTDHGGEIVALVQHGNILGTQFHPEKSGTAGLRVYANFVRLCARGPVTSAALPA
jgi:imidazole glycerol-phosphate synthase subunit HisH